MVKAHEIRLKASWSSDRKSQESKSHNITKWAFAKKGGTAGYSRPCNIEIMLQGRILF